jgi:glyceraldehyde-3-phosphate dehydrogenase (NADP+)
MPAHRRAAILERAAAVLDRDAEALAVTITAEEGKPIAEARLESTRLPGLLRLAAGEAVRIGGEVLPMDAVPAGEGRLGLTLPQPSGLVVALTPFNYPALLVMHKVAPALAAGNAVILKPASATPLTALSIREALLEAGLSEHALQCVIGHGAGVGPVLVSDRRVRKVTFTGSAATGLSIARAAGLKRLTCELGSNAAVIVFDDADPVAAAGATARAAFTNAGQVCISAQRVLVAKRAQDEFVHHLVEATEAYQLGDPTAEETTLGPLINAAESSRVAATVGDAGGTLLTGNAVAAGPSALTPAVVLQPDEDSQFWQEELFGPAVGVRSFERVDEALSAANRSRYGLAVGLFTRDLDRATRFMRELDAGVVHINAAPLWRTDAMPFGGWRDSGFGREGARYAIGEMTEFKTVVVHPS